VTEVRPHRGLFLARLARITTLDALLPWMQSRVDVDRADLPSLGEGEIYHFEAIGLEVRTVSGETVGTIVEIMALPANDVWVVRGSDEHGRELLVPAVGTIIREIDLGKRIAVIDPPTGLFDD
jgi:16S rRNA processing protein RimM